MKNLTKKELLEKLEISETKLQNAQDSIATLKLHKKALEQAIYDIKNSTMWRVSAPARHVISLIKSIPRNYKKVLRPANYKKAYWIIRNQGFSELQGFIHHHSSPAIEAQSINHSYHKWIDQFEKLNQNDIKEIEKNIANFALKPLISILMPVYNIEENWLRQAIDSVCEQIYDNWELCIADDNSTQPHVKTILDEYAKKDKRIKVTYRKNNGHISACSNSALALCTGEFVALMDDDDIIPKQALYHVVQEINNHPDCALIYSDEDKIDENNDRYDPYFKTDWNIDLFYGQNMFSHFGVFQRKILNKIGGFREGVEGSQDYDLVLRCLPHVKPSQIRHIPRILYHWRAIEGSAARSEDEKSYVIEASMNALSDYFKNTGEKNQIEEGFMPAFRRVIWNMPEKTPKVSIIIPTRNCKEILEVAINSIVEKTIYDNYEIIVVNNQSDDSKTIKYFKEISKLGNVSVIDYNDEFNYSAINNFAVKHAKGQIIALVNNDIEVISEGWLREMVSQAIRPEIGAVGAKLYFPNELIQHAGVITGFGETIEPVAGHSLDSLPREHVGYFGRAVLVQNYSAVTAACLVVEKKIYDKVGGLNEDNLAVAFNDVDFCLRVQDAGYRNLWTPYAELYHHESASRGQENTPTKKSRFASEVKYMRTRWQGMLDKDPYFNPNLRQISGHQVPRFPPKIQKY